MFLETPACSELRHVRTQCKVTSLVCCCRPSSQSLPLHYLGLTEDTQAAPWAHFHRAASAANIAQHFFCLAKMSRTPVTDIHVTL